jgi:hypothetical protein
MIQTPVRPSTGCGIASPDLMDIDAKLTVVFGPDPLWESLRHLLPLGGAR